MAALDCCHHERTPVERVRMLCVSALCLDAQFVIIFGTLVVKPMQSSEQTKCWESHNYVWHNAVTITSLLSMLAAAGGMYVHANVVCTPKITTELLINLSKYANALIFWVFFSTVLDIFAFNERPPECEKPDPQTQQQQDQAKEGEQTAEFSQDSADVFIEGILFLLWVAWVLISAVVASRARRVHIAPENSSPALPGRSELSASTTESVPSAAPSEVVVQRAVGVPVQGDNVQGVPVSGACPAPAAIGASGYGQEVCQGMPVAGAPAANPTGAPKTME